MGSQLPSTCYTMCCAKGKLWSFVVLFSVMVWSTCYGEVLDCNELFYSLDDIEEGIVLAGCKTDPDSVNCVELWGEKTVLEDLIYEQSNIQLNFYYQVGDLTLTISIDVCLFFKNTKAISFLLFPPPLRKKKKKKKKK